MKICLIGVFPEKLGAVKGGVANVILYLAQSLTKRGHDVHVITTGTVDSTVLDWEKITVHVVKPPSWLPRVLANPTFVRKKIHAKIRHIDPEFCHFHGSASYAFNYKRPHVLTLHGIPELDAQFTPGKANQIRSLARSKVERFCRRKIKNFIIITKYLNEFLGDQISGRQWIIENPASNLFFEATHSPKQNIFYAGMLSKLKNIFGLLQAFKLVHDRCPEAHLLIAGPPRDPEYIAQCDAYITANNLTDAVSFLGSLSTVEVKKALESAACLALLSFQESAPLIISEAMAVGVPVVASNVGGIPHMVENGITGFVVPPSDPVQAAERLLDILKDKPLANTLEKNARKSAQARFHIESITDKTLAVYQEIKSNWVP